MPRTTVLAADHVPHGHAISAGKRLGALLATVEIIYNSGRAFRRGPTHEQVSAALDGSRTTRRLPAESPNSGFPRDREPAWTPGKGLRDE